MVETAFTRLVGCTVPIQLAGMGSILSPELAAAVSEAGALGQLTFAGIPLDVAYQRLEKLQSLTSKPFGINQLIPFGSGSPRSRRIESQGDRLLLG